MRTFDETGNIGKDEFPLVDSRDTEVGVQRREGVIGDLRPGAGHGSEEGGLAGIRQADEAGIRDQLQVQPNGFFFALEAGIGPVRRLIDRRPEVGIAEAAIAAFCEAEALAFLGQVADEAFLILLEDLRADANLERHVVAIGAGTVLAHAVHADLGLEVLLVTKIDQRVEAIDGLNPDIAAAPAVTSVGPAELDEFLTAEGDAARATITRPDIDLCFIEKFHFTSSTRCVWATPLGPFDIGGSGGGQRIS